MPETPLAPPPPTPEVGTRAICNRCGAEIVYNSFAGMGFWEPDVTEHDPVTWRHATSGYAGCSISGMATPAKEQLTFAMLQEVGAKRCDLWHSGFPDNDDWNLADWSNAMQGEVGELVEILLEIVRHAGALGNVVKKMRRIEEDLVGNRGGEQDIKWEALADKAEEEAGDVTTYLDLLMTKMGRSLGVAVAKKFNKVSEELGFEERLPVA